MISLGYCSRLSGAEIVNYCFNFTLALITDCYWFNYRLEVLLEVVRLEWGLARDRLGNSALKWDDVINLSYMYIIRVCLQ